MSDSTSAAIRKLLSASPIFVGVSPRGLASLEAVARVKRLERGQMLFAQGDSADAFYLVASGSVSIGLDSASGRELVINEMRPGDCFGELGLITGQPRSTGAIASEPSVLWAISRQDFAAVLESEPALAKNLLREAARRLGKSSEREGALAFLDADSRLARVLLDMDRRAKGLGYITCSQEDLGRRVGLARQTVAELLGRWRRDGWILTGRGKIVLLNRAALRREAEEVESR
jgi:CRP-like cAMP-binding protein